MYSILRGEYKMLAEAKGNATTMTMSPGNGTAVTPLPPRQTISLGKSPMPASFPAIVTSLATPPNSTSPTPMALTTTVSSRTRYMGLIAIVGVCIVFIPVICIVRKCFRKRRKLKGSRMAQKEQERTTGNGRISSAQFWNPAYIADKDNSFGPPNRHGNAPPPVYPRPIVCIPLSGVIGGGPPVDNTAEYIYIDQPVRASDGISPKDGGTPRQFPMPGTPADSGEYIYVEEPVGLRKNIPQPNNLFRSEALSVATEIPSGTQSLQNHQYLEGKPVPPVASVRPLPPQPIGTAAPKKAEPLYEELPEEKTAAGERFHGDHPEEITRIPMGEREQGLDSELYLEPMTVGSR